MTHTVKLKKLYPRDGPKSHWVWVLRYQYPRCDKEASEVIGWYAPVRDSWQPQRCKGPRLTDKQAQEIRTQRRNDLREGRIGEEEQTQQQKVNDSATMPFPQWIESYVQATRGTIRETTLREYERALRDMDRIVLPKTAGAVDHLAVKRFIQARLKHGAKRTTVWKDISSLKRVWYDARIDPNPWTEPKLKRQLKCATKGWCWYSTEHFQRMMNKCDEFRVRTDELKRDGRKWLALKGMVAVAYTSGLRAGELNHLTWSDVNLEPGEIEITPKDRSETTLTWNPKDNERRIVPLASTARAILEELRQTADDGNPYVFLSGKRYHHILANADRWREGKPLINNLRRDFRRLCQTADVPVGEFHSLRKSCCTNLLEGGVAPHTVQKIMGHSSLETTIKYYSKVRRDQIAVARQVSEAYASGKSSQSTLRIKSA
jgi:integrase